MLIGRISGATRELGKPVNWNEDRDGNCGALAIRDMRTEQGANVMVSAWHPTPEEAQRILLGEPVYLWIWGSGHPPVALSVGDA